MSTQQTAITQLVEANGVRYAYRRLGPFAGVPIVLNMHFRGHMDFWDPAVINALAAVRPVIIYDNAGIGESSGRVPTTFAGWADSMAAMLEALNIHQIDLLGFSMGGCAAQMAALNHPNLVRKLILAGTRASINNDSPPSDWDLVGRYTVAETPEAVEAAWAEAFFTHNDLGRDAFKSYWARISERNGKAPVPLNQEKSAEQIVAWGDWDDEKPSNSAARLKELRMPVFVATGDTDILVATAGSFELAKKIPSSHFHVYPDAGHGFYGQHGATFAAHINIFLDTK
jgi:pimeloyl-ACP methyl ester carboxylesterase